MSRSANNLFFARGLALLGGLVALIRVWGFSLTQSSLMDEGEYLFKGYLFVTGQYWPFQDYGVWTNQMPLAFLIPGWMQLLFGVGIRTGRGYVWVLNVLIVIGLWFLVRRIVWLFHRRQAGDWLAAGAVWAYALNTATLKMYSTTTSQVLITCMLVGILLLILGKNRPFWQIVLGGMLAGVMLMTRLNLAPSLPFILLYIFLQHGKQAGIRASIAMLLVIGIGHAIFWPGIMRAWAAWAPTPFSEILAPWRPPEGTPFWDPSGTLDGRILSFLFMMRYHFVTFLGALVAILWGGWREPVQRRAVGFLSALFLVLLAAHAWASLGIHEQTDNALGNDYCIFCFPVYTSFFSILGIFLGVAWLASRPWSANSSRDGITLIGILLITTGVGFGAFQDIGDSLARLRIPRFRTLIASGETAPGIPLWDFLGTRFNLDFELTKRLLPSLAGFLIGLTVLGVAFWLSKRMAGRVIERPSVGAFAMTILLGVGMILSPTAMLGAGYTNYDCSGDVITAHEVAGAYLNQLIPPQSSIYWQGTLSSAPLLYLDRPQILPGQINLDYTLRLSGSDDAHLRFGFWTHSLAQVWLEQSDYALVAERYFKGWLREALENPDNFVELAKTVPLAPCNEDSYLRVFKNLQ